MAGILRCEKCKTRIPARVMNTHGMEKCPVCKVPMRVLVFPAYLNGTSPGRDPEGILSGNEASCFYHPEKQAVIPCENCGRFLCALCDMDLNGRHFCPGCLEQGKNKGKIQALENQRLLYDSMALRIAVYPLLLFYLTIITAPVAFFMALRFWNKPSSIIRRTKVRSILAVVISGAQIAAWAAFFYYIVAS